MNFKERLGLKRVGRIELSSGEFFVRSWSVAERQAFRTSWQDWPDGERVLRVCASALCDDQGNRLYTDDEFQQLSDADGATLEKLFIFTLRHNSILEDAVAEAKKN